MRISFLAAVIVLAFAAPPALATGGAAGDQPQSVDAEQGKSAQADDKSDKNRKVCRAETATGSVMPKRVCHTVAELEAMQAQAAATKENLRH